MKIWIFRRFSCPARTARCVLRTSLRVGKVSVYDTNNRIYFFDSIYCYDDYHWSMYFKKIENDGRLFARRKKNRAVDQRICIRHLVFFRCYFYWLRRKNRLAGWYRRYLDWHWQRADRMSPGLVLAGAPDKDDDAHIKIVDYAGIF